MIDIADRNGLTGLVALVATMALSVSLCLAWAAQPGTPMAAEGEVASSEPITPVPHVAVDESPAALLGEELFSDVRLSHDDSRSCMSCHDVHSNGADANTKDLSLTGHPLAHNTNTVFNAALSFRLGWAGTTRTLEDQADASLTDAGLMASSWPEIIGKLRADPDIVTRFQNVYGHGPDRDGLLAALAGYERTLLTPDSRFDLWLSGDHHALSTDEIEGYRLFKSAGCIACHQGVNVGGNLFEKVGIYRPLLEEEPRVMRVPSLRNVAVTAPYFHNGKVAVLNDAVRRMAEAQLGRDLSEGQISLITAFLGTLTGRYRGQMLAAPGP